MKPFEPITNAERVRAYSRGMSDDGVEIVVAIIESSDACIWHACHMYMLAFHPYPPCRICGGPCDPRCREHNLCHARVACGLPTPRLDSTPTCGCARCQGANA